MGSNFNYSSIFPTRQQDAFGNPINMGQPRELSAENQNTQMQIDWQREQLPLQQAFQGQQAAADRALQAGQGDANRAAQLSIGMAPWQYKDKLFGTFSPLISGLLGGAGGAGGGQGGGGLFSQFGGGLVGGQNTPQPQISATPIWNPQQVDQQVNAAKAGNEGKAQTQMQANARNTAASGFGSRSPLLAALNSGVGMATQANNTDADRNIRFQAAQGNAQHVLAGQQAQEGQWNDLQTADINRRKTNQSYVTSLAGMLAGLL